MKSIIEERTDLLSPLSFGGRGGGGGGGGGGSSRTATAICVGGAAATTLMAASPLTKNPYGIAATAVTAGVTAVACRIAGR
jgi:hypothetical protein